MIQGFKALFWSLGYNEISMEVEVVNVNTIFFAMIPWSVKTSSRVANSWHNSINLHAEEEISQSTRSMGDLVSSFEFLLEINGLIMLHM